MSDYGSSIAWVGILIALVPAFVLFVHLARSKKSMWLALFIGAVGWTVALLLRLPLLQGPFAESLGRALGAAASPYIGIGISSLFAGLFEEGIRYGLTKKTERTRVDARHVLSFGLGWGWGEALVLYAGSVLVAYLQGITLPSTSLLLGALERNIAVAIHVGLTFVIFRAVTDVKFLLVAIGTHFVVNFAGVSLLILTGNVWTTYGVAVIIAFILLGYAYRLTKSQTNSL